MLNSLFNRSKHNPEREQTEYIQYAQEVEGTLRRRLEAQLHENDDSEEIIHNIMKVACEFYQGDWVGFLELDLELNLWMPYVWYNPHDNDRTKTLLAEVESFDFFNRWEVAMRDNTAVSIPSTADLPDAPQKKRRCTSGLK